ncbi:MAG: UDP-phosphate galactose phosphotransferase [Cyclobacteriaceae bacterium]|nr:MAG: UDP-phosphate galactose phosphotransferase [Cyclobacteriaceae bacterium]
MDTFKEQTRFQEYSPNKTSEDSAKSNGFSYPATETKPRPKKFLFNRYLPILIFDLMALTLVLLVTYEFTSDRLIKGLSSTPEYLSLHLDRVIFYAFIVILVLVNFLISNLYKHSIIVSKAKQFYLIARSFLITANIVILFSFLFLNYTVSESLKDFLIWFTVSGIFISFTLRLIFKYLIKNNQFLSTARPPKRLIIIGAGEIAKLYAARMNSLYGIKKLVFLDDDEEKLGSQIFGFPVIGKPEEVGFQAITIRADEIWITISNIAKERLLEIIKYSKRTGLPIKVISSQYNLMFTGMYEKSHDLLTTIPLHVHNNARPLIDSIKRFVDIIGALILLTAALIPGLIIAALIKMDSPGPVFYRSFRVGARGSLFKMYKFRSMSVNTEYKHKEEALERLKEGKHMGKVVKDPRITRIGKFIRKYSLDELPQLLNVLKGDMSLVGPRPCFEYEMKMFEEWHHRRFLMKPGITGLWQVTGRQINDILLDDAMTTDVFYTDNHSLWMDLRILFKTIPVVLYGRGN